MTLSFYASYPVVLSDKVADDSAGRIDPLTQSESDRGRGSALFKLSTYIRCVSVVEFHDRALCIGKVLGQELTVVE